MEFVPVFFTALLIKVTSSVSAPEISISVGGTALLPCQKSPNTTVAQWHRRNKGTNNRGSTYTTLTDGLSVYHDRMAIHSGNYDLQITNVTETDSGTYRCVVENKSGIQFTEFILRVKDIDTSTMVDATNSTEHVKPLKPGISIIHLVIVPLTAGAAIIISGSAVVLCIQKRVCTRHQSSENITVSGGAGEQDTVPVHYQPLTEKWQDNSNKYADIAEGLQRQSNNEIILHIYDECDKPVPQPSVYQSLIKGDTDAINIYD